MQLRCGCPGDTPAVRARQLTSQALQGETLSSVSVAISLIYSKEEPNMKITKVKGLAMALAVAATVLTTAAPASAATVRTYTYTYTYNTRTSLASLLSRYYPQVQITWYTPKTTQTTVKQPSQPTQQTQQPKPQTPTPAQQSPQTPVSGLTAAEQQMLNLVNQERAKAGLSPLEIDPTLVKLARMKAQDMIDKGYFSHTSPTYGSPFDMMRAYGVTYSYAGENLAGAGTVNSAHTNLMNSSGHRANILNGNYTKVGIGVVSGGPYGKMFVQLFIG